MMQEVHHFALSKLLAGEEVARVLLMEEAMNVVCIADSASKHNLKELGGVFRTPETLILVNAGVDLVLDINSVHLIVVLYY
jgi:hypothetical protein